MVSFGFYGEEGILLNNNLIRPNQGVSVITCTHLPNYMSNVFRNYAKQNWKLKELIIILNNNRLNLLEWRRKAAIYKNIRVYQLPGTMSLGRCLNFGVSKSRYHFIAKFDHDDYYASGYLAEAMGTFQKKKADVVGKRSYYAFLEQRKLLIIRFPNFEHQYFRHVHGGTFVIRKHVFNKVKFADRSLGEDVKFMQDCRKNGFKIYSASKRNYVYIRRSNQRAHTWKVDDEYLLKDAKIIASKNSLKGMFGTAKRKALKQTLNGE